MENLKKQFLLKEDITFLNFGSFGASPKPVFDKYQSFQLEMEQDPVNFIVNVGLKYLKQSRVALTNYLSCNENDLVYVTNPSYAVNLVAKSMALQADDEILATNIEYGACDKTWEYYCKKANAKYIRQAITLPLKSNELFVEEFFKGVTDKTKLIFLSHITSTTALCFPVDDVCKKAKQLGIKVFIDGAHAPAHVPLNISELQPDFYTGACHKWMMTPKGSSFLYVKKEWQPLEPLIVSWGYNALFPSDSTFLDYHQMNGTRDYTAFLCIPEAIDFMLKHQWDLVTENCREIVKNNALELSRLLGSEPLAPIEGNFINQMYSTQIKTAQPEKLHDLFYEKYNIQIPVMRQDEKVYLRYSINAFNSQADLDILFDAVKDIKTTTSMIE